MTLPPEVLAVFREFRTCEFSTIGRDGTPLAWPTSARYLPEQEQFLLTTSIVYPQKAFNIRRNPHVALLFSNPTASGLDNPPAVLVQGLAAAPDKIVTSVAGLEDYWRDTIFRRQPASRLYSSNALMRYLTDWYYMRIVITVRPQTIRWWPSGDFSRSASQLVSQSANG
jgi:hypothetical protein